MPDLLIRDVSQEVHDWLDNLSHQNRVAKNTEARRLLQWLLGIGVSPSLFEQPPPPEPRLVSGLPFTFIDVFAGIGGMRFGLEAVGGRCVFSCEYDPFAQKTYHEWFGEWPKGDIYDQKPYDEIPDHDILAAGFPCQPFSIAGVSKKKSLGRAHGFEDKKQGNLFFELRDIVAVKRPPVVFLENVKNLRTHDKKQTWEVIHRTLDEELDYEVHAEIIDAAGWVPQHRERIFIVCFDRKVFGCDVAFSFPQSPGSAPPFSDVLEDDVDPKYTLSDKLWNYLQAYREKHLKKGNGFGFGLADLNGVSRTISARYYKDGSEILVQQEDGLNPRRLTPTEAQRLMGFPRLPIPVSDTQAYKQFGNAVVPLVVEAVGQQIVEVLASKIVHENGCLLKRPGHEADARAA